MIIITDLLLVYGFVGWLTFRFAIDYGYRPEKVRLTWLEFFRVVMVFWFLWPFGLLFLITLRKHLVYERKGIINTLVVFLGGIGRKNNLDRKIL